MTATNTLFIIAFVAVVLLSVFFGGGAMTGDTIKGGTGEAGWRGHQQKRASPNSVGQRRYSKFRADDTRSPSFKARH
jgi:hypothetical protein